MNILLAEDQAMVRTALASLLRLEGDFTVTEAADGQAALKLLKQTSFDLLLVVIVAYEDNFVVDHMLAI